MIGRAESLLYFFFVLMLMLFCLHALEWRMLKMFNYDAVQYEFFSFHFDRVCLNQFKAIPFESNLTHATSTPLFSHR